MCHKHCEVVMGGEKFDKLQNVIGTTETYVI